MIKISNEEEGERAGDSSLKSCKYWKLQVNNPWAAKIVSSFGQEQEKKNTRRDELTTRKNHPNSVWLQSYLELSLFYSLL